MIKIPKAIFKKEYDDKISYEDLALYSYIQTLINKESNCKTSIRKSIEYFNYQWNINKTNVYYGNNGRNSRREILRLKDKKKIINSLINLRDLKLIKIENLENMDEFISRDLILKIKCNNIDSDFIEIDKLTFNNLIHKIGCIGWYMIISELYHENMYEKMDLYEGYLGLFERLGLIKALPCLDEEGYYDYFNIKFNFENYLNENHREEEVKSKEMNTNFTELVLEEYLYDNLNLIEEDMCIITNQYQVEDGRIDILARDKNDILCIIELKINDVSKDLIYQCAYYPTQFQEITRLMVICPSYSKKINLALSNLPYVEKYTYEMEDNNLSTLKIQRLNHKL